MQGGKQECVPYSDLILSTLRVDHIRIDLSNSTPSAISPSLYLSTLSLSLISKNKYFVHLKEVPIYAL